MLESYVPGSLPFLLSVSQASNLFFILEQFLILSGSEKEINNTHQLHLDTNVQSSLVGNRRRQQQVCPTLQQHLHNLCMLHLNRPSQWCFAFLEPCHTFRHRNIVRLSTFTVRDIFDAMDASTVSFASRYRLVFMKMSEKEQVARGN